MPVTIKVKSKGDAIRIQREQAAQRVISHFGLCLPQSTKVLCFLDDEDPSSLKQAFGAANRGLSGPIRDGDDLSVWPDCVQKCVYVDNDVSPYTRRVIDHLVYLHGSTCTDEVGLTMTLAHELQRRRSDKSTTRRDWYRDIFLGLGEPERFKLVSNILNEVQASNPDLCAEIRTMMSGGVLAPSASIPEYAWSSDRLNEYLNGMDGAIATGDYKRAVTMAYTCLEGFLGAFVRAKSPGRTAYPNEIVALSKEVCDHLKGINKDYPDEVLNLIKHSAHAVDKARNRFSESHFGGDAGLWLATYMRDQVNTQIRLLLHFM